MTISKLLLKPYIERLKSSFQTIEKGLDARSEEQVNLGLRIRKHVSKLDELLLSVASSPSVQETVVPSNWFETCKKVKLELRFTQRKMKRFVSNEVRFQKSPKGLSHVSTFAA